MSRDRCLAESLLCCTLIQLINLPSSILFLRANNHGFSIW
jgi:hypothetical protein